MPERLIAEGHLVDESRPPIIVVLGNTGTGKTGITIEMSDQAEAVCADRFTAWAEMDLGVAKPTAQERARMPHHLVNAFHPGELVGRPQPGYVHLGGRQQLPVMRDLAWRAIDTIAARDRVPIIVGGSVPAIQEITLGFTRAENPELKTMLDGMTEKQLRELCAGWGMSQYFEYPNPLDAIRRKIYTVHTADELRPLPNVYPIGIKHDMHHLIQRIQDRLDQMWEQGLPEEVERLVDTYGWVGPLTEAIGYKEFMPGPDGQKPNPDKVRRTILANTIGFVWSQSLEFGDMIPVHWARNPEHAIEIGRWVIDQWKSNGLQATRTFYYPWTLDGKPRERRQRAHSTASDA